jgi:hypothetical protein
MKQDEGVSTIQDTDDQDFWWINFTGSLAKWLTFGMYHEWLHNRTGSSGSLFGGAGHVPGGSVVLGGYAGDHWWHGFHVSLSPWILYSRFHFNYYHGSIDDEYLNPARDYDDPDGWAFIGRLGVRLGPAKIGLRGWYFSGNDEDNFDAVDPDWDRWVGPDSWFSPFEIFYSGSRQWAGASNGQAVNPGGTAALCLEADWQVTKKLLLDLLAGYIWATDEDDKGFFALMETDGTQNDDAGLGFEINLRATYKIYPHLTLDLVAAYFIADEGLEHGDAGRVHVPTGTVVPAIFEDGDEDDAYELFWRLVYTF